jgi:hypothetical protein
MTSVPPSTISSDDPSSGSPTFHAAVAAMAALGFGWLGALFGQDAGYALARLLRRDPAEVKDMLIWMFIASPFVMAALGIWLALVMTGAGRAARTVALSFLVVVTAGAVAMMTASYDWPKTTGTPVYDYELRLPTGVPLSNPNLLDLTMWDEKTGSGCSVTDLRHIDGRVQVSGKFTLGNDNHAPRMSMRLREGTIHPHPEAYWRLPVMLATKVEAEFSPWHKIEFITAPRVVPSVPPGDYEIRYRLRRFM